MKINFNIQDEKILNKSFKIIIVIVTLVNNLFLFASKKIRNFSITYIMDFKISFNKLLTLAFTFAQLADDNEAAFYF